MSDVEVVVAHRERATLRVGEVFLKVDGDADRVERELEAMALAPVPTAEVLWRQAPVTALTALRGVALGKLGVAECAPPEAWAAAGDVVRRLHDAPLPPWPSRSLEGKAPRLDAECAWLVSSGTVPADLVAANREIATAALAPHEPVFMHGDLQVAHVFVDGTEVTGVLDWSEAGRGAAAYDLASLTLGHRERLPDVLGGYGADVDEAAISGWWSLRCLTAVRWLVEHGFDPAAPGCEIDVLRAQVGAP